MATKISSKNLDKHGKLGWALPDGLTEPPMPDWLSRVLRPGKSNKAARKTTETDLLGWLDESAHGAATVEYAVETLAVCRAVPQLTKVLSPDLQQAVIDHLVDVTTEADAKPPEDHPLPHQLLAGELALTLAYLFPKSPPCRKLKSSARRALSAGLVELLDGEGLPHAKHMTLLRPLLACWTRCRAIGSKLRGRCWSAAAENQYQWLVRHALSLTRHDGSHVFSNGSSAAWDAELFDAALRFGGNEDDHRIAALVLPGPWKSDAKQISESELPEPANHSEWAATAVLRRQWKRSAERLTVLYDEPAMRVELSCGKDVVFSGTWGLEVSCDGKALDPKSDWENVCWTSDDDADYLELEIDLRGGVRVQRSMLLAREDRFLLMADAVLCNRPGAIEYRGRLPLGPGISFDGAEQFHEGILAGSRPRAKVLPLALPEWKADKQLGELVQTQHGLELRQSQQGRRLFAPLFFDLDRRRYPRAMTWRQLTVAESLEIQPSDVAVGYRIAIGRQQWLIYRSLAGRANRTLLGHNLSSEMLVARFDSSGEVRPLVEIE